jgi:hypothetical protein
MNVSTCGTAGVITVDKTKHMFHSGSTIDGNRTNAQYLVQLSTAPHLRSHAMDHLGIPCPTPVQWYTAREQDVNFHPAALHMTATCCLSKQAV